MEGSVIPEHLKMSREQVFPNYTDYVIMKADPLRTNEFGRQMIFCDKYNQTNCEVFFLKIELDLAEPDDLRVPMWVRHMNASIFKQIGGVIYYNFKSSSSTSGWIILFNIDGRPKYCATDQNNLSDEVRHERHLIPNLYSVH